MSYSFERGSELLELCRLSGLTIGRVMLERELERGEAGEAALLDEMKKNLAVMRASIEKGLDERCESVSGLTGGDAGRLFDHAQGALLGALPTRAVTSSMAVVEVNAAMGRIVAAPTAGASGILPGALISVADARGWDDDKIVLGLFTAGAIGTLIAANATIAGAEGGCQAETGAAAAMAAAAITELSGGKPAACLDAAAMALKNVMGLVCDPVAGLVECPCIKRNALGALNALLCADMALAGINSLIPFDDAVSAMRSVGRLMSPDLKETARGGCAATAAGRTIASQLRFEQG